MPRGRQRLLGLGATTAAMVGVVLLLTIFTNIDWFYPRVVTTAAVLVVSLLTMLLVRALVPHRWRPPGLAPAVLATVAGYLSIRIAVAAGWSEFLDHEVLESLEGEVDDLPTWVFAAAGGIAIFGALSAFSCLLPRFRAGRRR